MDVLTSEQVHIQGKKQVNHASHLMALQNYFEIAHILKLKASLKKKRIKISQVRGLQVFLMIQPKLFMIEKQKAYAG